MCNNLQADTVLQYCCSAQHIPQRMPQNSHMRAAKTYSMCADLPPAMRTGPIELGPANCKRSAQGTEVLLGNLKTQQPPQRLQVKP